MSVVKTDLRVRPVAPARSIYVEAISGLTANDAQSALSQIEGQVLVNAASPPAIVPKAVNFAMSPYTVLPTDYLLEVDTTGGVVVLQTGASALRGNKPFTVKDIVLNSSVNRIDVLRTGAETLDGLTTYSIASDGDAKTFTPKLAGNGYEVTS